jgi:hypothetical protein
MNYYKNKNKIDPDLIELSRKAIIDEIMKLRNAIRYARDQVGDDKCWLDFFRLFEFLPEYHSMNMNREVLSEEEMLNNCKTFISCINCYLNNPEKSIDEIYGIWRCLRPY